MIAASIPVQRPKDAKLLSVDSCGNIRHLARSAFADLLRATDLVIANDAATLPASLFGHHLPSGSPIEVRLAGRSSISLDKVTEFAAIVFGSGDFRIRTEDRPLPPVLSPGDRLQLGPLQARVVRVLAHPRYVLLHLDGSAREIWAGLAHHGRPIQYAHVETPLAHWNTWSPVAGLPVAFEPASASFVLDWNVLATLRARGIRFATITHAAGVSSTGDPVLDAMLPFDEPYRIPRSTALAIELTKARAGRIIAIGTTVVRALEHAAMATGTVRAGDGVANRKITPSTRLHVVDAILSGTHEPGSSHYELLRAFTEPETLRRADRELEMANYRTHEFGDSVFLERQAEATSASPCPYASTHLAAAAMGTVHDCALAAS